jgi:hypothetical protein
MTDHEHRTAALKLALQLPPGRDDAQRVLNLLCTLVDQFLWIAEQPPRVRTVDFGSGEKWR